MKTVLILLIILIIYACNPQNIRRDRQEQTGAQPDSFLYYQPVKLENKFLDSLKQDYDNEVSVKIRLYPPPPPPAPKTKKTDGFRIQLFAGADSINVWTSAQNIKNALPDSIYFFREKNLYKIQLGDFIYRSDADFRLMDLRAKGYPGAWVVKQLINVPVDSTGATPIASGDTLVKDSASDAKYTIQVMVTSSIEKAESLVEQLKIQFKEESYYKKSATFYKIYLGKFANRDQAEKTLNTVKTAGYEDAWLVY